MNEFDPTHILEVLHRHEVRFVLVGGLAAVAWGSAVVTRDLDLTPDRELANLDRLAAALTELDARLRVNTIPEGVATRLDGRFLATQVAMNFTTDAGDVDLTAAPAGFPEGYVGLARGASAMDLGAGSMTQVAALADVITSKRAAGRPKDLAALPHLEALRDELRHQGPETSSSRSPSGCTGRKSSS